MSTDTLPERYRSRATSPTHPLRAALMSVAATAVNAAYAEGIDEETAESRKLRAVQLRRMADTI